MRHKTRDKIDPRYFAETIVRLWGEPSSRTGNEWRWGSKGSRCATLDKMLWSDFEAGEGGDIVSLIQREMCVDIGAALKIVDNDFPDDYTPPPVTHKPNPKPSTLAYAKRLWAAGERDDAEVASHPYAERKGITWAAGAGRGTASGKLIGQNSDCIIIPLRTWGDDLTGVEVINTEGKKQTFGRKGVLQLGNTLDKTLPIYVVEGWADGVATWSYYDNVVVVVAFGIARQQSLVQAIYRANPKRAVVAVLDRVAT